MATFGSQLFRLVLVLSALVFAATGRASNDIPVIAAASDLQFVIADLADAFAAQTGREVEVALGASGNLSRQIRQGAPMEVFLSADEVFVQDLAAAGLTEDDGTLYAIGRLALAVPHGSPLKADGTLAGLRTALAEQRLKKFAIANPQHAPYGKRAAEALRHVGVWDDMTEKLVLGENVAQAAQFALSGSADGGLIAHSLALSPNLAARGSFALVPEDWHQPLRQRMVLIKGAGETARMFYDFVMSAPARTILNRYGFILPGEAM